LPSSVFGKNPISARPGSAALGLEWATAGAGSAAHRYRCDVLSVPCSPGAGSKGRNSPVMEPTHHVGRSFSGQCLVGAVRSFENSVLRASDQNRVDVKPLNSTISGSDLHDAIR